MKVRNRFLKTKENFSVDSSTHSEYDPSGERVDGEGIDGKTGLSGEKAQFVESKRKW